MRTTPQAEAVAEALRHFGHATNHRLLSAVLVTFPNLTATTVHRITTRLIAEGLASRGPELGGAVLIDANPAPHDHFICQACGGVRDIHVSSETLDDLQRQLGRNLVGGGITITGTCAPCRPDAAARPWHRTRLTRPSRSCCA